VPEAKKREYRENIDAWANAWRKQVVATTAKDVVAAACKRHLIQSREAMKSYGCEF
jgi:anti-sigma-K factor RskA